MLPAQNRMRRSADFGATVKRGRRAVQPDAVLYSRVIDDAPTDLSVAVSDEGQSGVYPQVGLIIAKSVGSAVDRHRVARRLRHVVRDLLGELHPREMLVIRALPSSSVATSQALSIQVRAGLGSIRRATSAAR